MNNHLTREQMLAYLDGELPKAQTATATEHLHSCWTCRIEMERLEGDIAIILDAHNESFVTAIPSPPSAWPSFDALLAKKLPEAPQPVWMRIGNATRAVLMPARAVILAGLIAGVVLFAFFKFESKSVSAKEVLRSVQAAANQRMNIPQGRVIRERVHIRRTVRGQDVGFGSVNVWKSPTTAVWQDSDSDSVAALKQEYGKHGVPVDLPLSAPSINAWGKAAGGEPSAEKQGSDLNVSFPGSHDSGESTRMILRIQPGTWHVEAMTLQFPDASFEVTEDDFSIVPTSDVPPVLLAELEPGPQLSAPVVARPVSDAMLSPVHLPEINLDQVQLNVLATLHRLHADLGEPVTVTHSNHKVEVGVWQLPPDRQNEIRVALQDEPGVLVQTTALASRPMTAAVSPPVPIPSPATTQIVVPSEVEDQRLLKFFGDPEKEQIFTRDALTKSTTILAHLYALRNLQAQFPPEREQTLSPEAQAQLASIIRDHAVAVSTALNELQSQLAHLNAAFNVATTFSDLGSDSSETRWQDASIDALGVARTADHLLRNVLTTSETPVAPDAGLPELQQKLSHLASEMRDLQKK